MQQWIKSTKKMQKTQGNLIYTSTVNMAPDDWLMFRNRGIGASEVGYIMGLSPYKSNVELFYEKIGEKRGELKKAKNIAISLAQEGESIERIARILGETEKTIKEWLAETH